MTPDGGGHHRPIGGMWRTKHEVHGQVSEARWERKDDVVILGLDHFGGAPQHQMGQWIVDDGRKRLCSASVRERGSPLRMSATRVSSACRFSFFFRRTGMFAEAGGVKF